MFKVKLKYIRQGNYSIFINVLKITVVISGGELLIISQSLITLDLKYKYIT
ncbi:hypothetical protein NRP93_001500 [Clostridium botulinum]|nr:hypothetical protein [Clostridium botulinum]